MFLLLGFVLLLSAGCVVVVCDGLCGDVVVLVVFCLSHGVVVLMVVNHFLHIAICFVYMSPSSPS